MIGPLCEQMPARITRKSFSSLKKSSQCTVYGAAEVPCESYARTDFAIIFSVWHCLGFKVLLAEGSLHIVSRALTQRLVWAAGLAQPGKIERGARAESCKNHLHQLHVCLPAGPGRTRLLYRMSMDFLHWTKAVPGIQAFWAHIAQQVCAPPLSPPFLYPNAGSHVIQQMRTHLPRSTEI